MKNKNRPILLIANSSWYLFHYRNLLIKTLKKNNYVVTLSPYDNFSQYLEENSINFLWYISQNSKEINPDTSSSLNFEELEFLCKMRDELSILKKYKLDKNIIAKKLVKTKKLFTKSLSLKESIKKGDLIKEDNLYLKKPGTGIPYSLKYKFVYIFYFLTIISYFKLKEYIS